MTRYLVAQWNGQAWTLDNTYHAIVAAGPYDSVDLAQTAIEHATAEAAKASPDESLEAAEWYANRYVRECVKVLAVEWPE